MADDFNERLLAITKGCRHDMHEPDEQGLSARIVGDELDNAFGEQETAHLGFQEIVAILTREGAGEERFNLATLIALARVGAHIADMLPALKRLETAASNRDNTMGDPIRLLDVKAELQAASELARAVIAKAECHA